MYTYTYKYVYLCVQEIAQQDSAYKIFTQLKCIVFFKYLEK